LRLGLIDRRPLRLDLLADTLDRRLLGRHLAARAVNREAIVAVVDFRDHVAGMHVRIVVDDDRLDIAGDLGGERRVLRADIGVVGRDEIAPGGPVVVAIPAAARQHREQRHSGNHLAAQARLRLRGRRHGLVGPCAAFGRHCASFGRRDGPGRPGSFRLLERRSRCDGGVRTFGGGQARRFILLPDRPSRGDGQSIGRVAVPIHGVSSSSRRPALSACQISFLTEPFGHFGP